VSVDWLVKPDLSSPLNFHIFVSGTPFTYVFSPLSLALMELLGKDPPHARNNHEFGQNVCSNAFQALHKRQWKTMTLKEGKLIR
jgi:hypothetical protein